MLKSPRETLIVIVEVALGPAGAVAEAAGEDAEIGEGDLAVEVGICAEGKADLDGATGTGSWTWWR